MCLLVCVRVCMSMRVHVYAYKNSGGASFRVAELDLKQAELVLEQAELIIIEQVELKTAKRAGAELRCAPPQFKH